MDRIERNIPLPELNRYPFPEMTEGDSFTRPGMERNRLCAAACRYKYTHLGWNYTTRREGRYVRLWCLAVPQQEGTD